ncbi:MAG: hypothetical protein OXT65_02990 [Alphaproteobacteria bacterium]|nr:hypothetical protein [Alphaproteobacteria bacterium]
MERQKILETIFHLKKPDELDHLAEQLRSVGWDSPDGEVAHLTSAHIISILERYLDGRLTEQQVEDWANLVEAREDITFGVQEEDEDMVTAAIHDLANPALEGNITHESAKKLVSRLRDFEA